MGQAAGQVGWMGGREGQMGTVHVPVSVHVCAIPVMSRYHSQVLVNDQLVRRHL